MIDHISDLISKLKIGIITHQNYILVKNTKFNYKILNRLYLDGFINSFNIEKDKPWLIKISIKYIGTKKSYIKDIKRISTSGRRVYKSAKEIAVNFTNYDYISISGTRGLYPYHAFNKDGGEIILIIKTN